MMAEIATAVNWLVSGIATAQRVKQSIMVRMYLYPRGDMGSESLPPIMFIARQLPRPLYSIGKSSTLGVRQSRSDFLQTKLQAM